MENSGESQPQPQQQSGRAYRRGTPHTARRGRADRGRGAGGRGRGGGTTATTETQVETQPSAGQQPSEDATTSSGRRGRGGFRDGRVRSAARGGLVPGTQRRFGGHITTAASEASGSGADPSGPSAGLSADAPEFVPGQPIAQRIRPPPKPRDQPLGSLAPKSAAPDLPTRIHEDINNSQYECVICTSEVLRSSRVWSCTICWTVVHLPCVKRWYTNQMTKNDPQQQQSQQDLQGPKAWRCPGCNLPMTEEPGTYHCWCGKEINPRSIPGLAPHSCGQTCSKPRPTCPHPCPLECHSGPCPPCELAGPTQSCFCGKNTVTKRCVETDYDHGWSCQEVCGDLLPCGEHECPRRCHADLCGSCEVPVESRCYCGKVEKEVVCDARGDVLQSFDIGTGEAGGGEWFEGCFECDSPCGRKFDCGKHLCEKTCHPQDEQPAHCPFSPDVVLDCPCGKTPLYELLNTSRQTCQDPIPHCAETCGKTLPCGHTCSSTCHTGACQSCTQQVDVSCRCGRVVTQSICLDGEIVQPMCFRICQATLNCGRHQCGERCCPGEKKYQERQAAKRKNKLQASGHGEDVEAEHICIRVCGRLLKCGSHHCQQICHKGPCPSCLEAVFEEISCSCGRTVLQPPQPCGTRAPECRFECTRQPTCGHPRVQHTCHPDEVACPKCPFLVEKACVCGKQRLKNQPCWFEDARCGLPCGKKLQCGSHTCKKQCHKPGQCEDAEIRGSHCAQPCGKTRKSCDHTCLDECHAPFPCKEDKPCQSRTFITCECQRRKQEVKCLATKANPSPSREQLQCDDECLRLQRNHRLAAALHIDPDSHTDDHIPYSDTTLKLFRENLSWAQTQEREFRVFAGDASEKRIRFKPMPSSQRAFLHALAEDYGLDSMSQDPEPHRHVCVFKTPRFVSAPKKTLAQCVKIRLKETAVGSAASSSSASVVAPKEPYNALLLVAPRFGMTIEEVDAAIASDAAAYPLLNFSTGFLPSEEVVVRASTSGTWGAPTAAAVETSVTALRGPVSKTVVSQGLAKGVILCHADTSLNILRRELTSGAGGGSTGVTDAGGWSSVVSRAAMKRANAAENTKPAEQKVASSFVGLKKKTEKEKEKKVAEPVEDDWETAAERLEE